MSETRELLPSNETVYKSFVLITDDPHDKPSKCSLVSITVAFILAILFLVCATVLPLIIQNMIHSQIENQVPLKVNGSLTYSAWVSPPAPIYMQFWFFNVTNPSDVIEHGAKPHLKHIGPVTYQEKRLKVNIEFHDDNGTVSYNENRTYHYVPEMSVIKENDTFTNINLPLLVLGNMIRYRSSFIQNLVEKVFESFDKGGVFITKTAAEVLWGYEDPALKTASGLLKPFGIHIDPMVGIFYGKNGTDDGRYNVFTGEQNRLSQFVHIHTWNQQTDLPYWSTSKANRINGTDGSMFGPFLNKTTRQYIFASDLCRSIYVEFVKETSVRGVPSYFYTAPGDVFANSTENPDNEGFCIPNCLGSGLLNMSNCQPQAPAVMSPPHFYQTDPKVMALIDGLEPSIDDQTELSIEPMTGVVLNAQKKLQINMAVEPVSGFRDMKKFPPIMFLPFLWLNESALVDEASAAQMRDTIVFAGQLSNLLNFVLNVVGLLILGVVAIVTVIILFRWIGSRNSNHQSKHKIPYDNLIVNEDNNTGNGNN